MISKAFVCVAHSVDYSSKEKKTGQDEGWEREDKWTESYCKNKRNWMLNEMIKRPVGSIVMAFITLSCQKYSAFRTIFGSTLVDEQVCSQVSASPSHDSALVPSWIPVEERNQIRKYESWEICPLKIIRFDKRNPLIILCCISFPVYDRCNSRANTDEYPRNQQKEWQANRWPLCLFNFFFFHHRHSSLWV